MVYLTYSEIRGSGGVGCGIREMLTKHHEFNKYFDQFSVFLQPV